MKKVTTGPFGMGIVYDYKNIIETDSNIGKINFDKKVKKNNPEPKGYAKVYSKKIEYK